MKGEYVFQKGVGKTIVFPLIADGSDAYYTGSLASLSIDAYKYGQANAPVSITISSTVSQLGSTGLCYVTISNSETDIGNGYEYIVIKISDGASGFKEQTVILSSAVKMNHLSIEADDTSEPALNIKGADSASVASVGLRVTGGSTTDSFSNAAEAIKLIGGNADVNGGAGEGLHIVSGFPNGTGMLVEGDGASGTAMELSANRGLHVVAGDVGIAIGADDNGIDITSNGRGIRVQGGADFAAVELRGGNASGADNAGEGLLIVGGVASGTGSSGTGVRVVGGDGGAMHAPGDGISVVGGASDDGTINAGNGIVAAAGAAVTAGGAGIKAVASGDGIDLDADNLQGIQDIPGIETKIDTVDSNVDAILVDTGTTIPATLSTIDGKIDTIDTVVDGVASDVTTIDSNVDAIVAKLPSGSISGFELSDTVDSVPVSQIFEYIMAMFNGRYLIDNPSAGDITFFKRDNVTGLSVINRTNVGRTRVS